MLTLVLSAGPIAVAPALAHDSWISQGEYTNFRGEWCCGAEDCFSIPEAQVEMTPHGFKLFGQEVVPAEEAMISIDGRYWRCQRADGSRRCFFAPMLGS